MGGGGALHNEASKTAYQQVNSFQKPSLSKLYLCLGIIFNIALLGFFKYTDFFLENFNLFAQLFHFNFTIPLPHIVLPLAISFFTFQQIAFLVDTYKDIDTKDMQEGKSLQINFLDYMLFVSFFPQLIAGPIVHHKEMMPQFARLLSKANTRIFHWQKIAKGLFIFSIGLFKKVCIADSFALWASGGFEVAKRQGELNIFEAWATSLSYTFQIYFDFSGYCDMAIGLGLLFGIMLPINFNSPYKALNIADFWRRWHITLGRFLKQYLYFPLGGNKFGKMLCLRNLFIVAFISGIWHGAGWGFVIWGILHGLALMTHRIYGFYLSSLEQKGKVLKFCSTWWYKLLMWFITFNFINITWVFFRSENLNQALYILKAMFGFVWVELPEKLYKFGVLLDNINAGDRTIAFFVLAFVLCLSCKNSIEHLGVFKPNLKYIFITGASLYAALIYMSKSPYTEFIYFNF